MKRFLTMILALALVLSFAGCAASDYKKATEAFSAGDYDTARAMYAELGDYQDSAELVKECDYQLAKGLYDSGDLAAAVSALEALGDYEDCAELLLAAKDELLKQMLVGKWISGEIDGTDTFMAGLNGSMTALGGGNDFLDYLDLPAFRFQYCLEFTDKGTIVKTLDEEVFRQSVEAITKAYGKAFLAYMEDTMTKEAEAKGLSYDDLLAYAQVSSTEELISASLGMSLDEYIELLLGEAFKTISEMKENGTYTVENGEISLHTGSETEKGTYDFEKEELTLTGEGAPEEQKFMYPMTFTKQ